MSKIDLSKYGITGVTEIVHNPSYEQLFEEETKPGLQGFEKGQLTDMGAVNVMTGVYTGRSPKDKFFVMDDTTKDTIWWTSDEYKNDNKPLSQQSWKVLKEIADKQLSDKRLFVVDTFCGANENSRLKIRFIMEVAWQAHFVTNMFIRPTAEELAAYGEPDFVVLNASKAKVENYKELGLNSETAVVFNLTEKMQKSGAKAYLVNTGWNGTGKRISIKDTRGIIDAILDGSIDKAPTKKIPYFDFEVPTALPGVDPNILDPRDTYADAKQWDEKAKDLAERFIKNFKKFEGNEAGKKLVAAGPKL